MSMFTHKIYNDGEALVYDAATKKFIGGVSGGGGGGATDVMLRAQNYFIYTDGTSYYSKTGDGTTAHTASTPDSVFQNTFNTIATATGTGQATTTIFVGAGTYTFSAGFTGLTYTPRHSSIIFARNAVMRVPNGFAGVGFKIQPTATEAAMNIHIQGGHWNEAGSGLKDWIAFQLYVPASATNDGILEVRLKDILVYGAGTALELKVDRSDGWINGNFFEGLHIKNCERAINFQRTGARSTTTVDSKGFNRNVFSNIMIQPDITGTVLDQIDNVKDDNNVFDNVQTWDVPEGLYSIDISSEASLTHIKGGMITFKNWRSQSPTTIIDGQDEQVRGPFSDAARNVGTINTINLTGGTGLLEGHVNYTTPTNNVQANGPVRRYSTTTTSGTITGLRTGLVFQTGMYPAIRMMMQPNATTNIRYFIGWINTSSTLAATDTFPNNTYCLGFMKRTSDTNWQIVSNANTASASYVDTGVAETGNTHTFRLIMLDTTRVFYRIGNADSGGTDKWRTATVSNASGQDLAFHAVVSNSAAEDKRLSVIKLKLWASMDT